MNRVFVAILVAALTAAGQGTKASGARTALNRVLHGEVLALKGRTVTLYYDFEDPAQLQDFEEARPPNLLDASENRARIENGRLVLDGSTSIRHKTESAGALHATFTMRPDKARNVGAVITEPILSEFYVVYNAFDYRFNRNGHMHIGAVGLHEDEGAEDRSTGLVNFRDVFGRDVRKRVRAGKDVAVAISKDGWDESFAVGRTRGKGTSKGKTKNMRDLKFGLFVHDSSASFDDLTITCTLGDEYLDLEDLTIDLDAHVDEEIAAHALRGNDARQMVHILSWPWLPKRKRKAAAQALADRGNAKVLRLLLPALRAADKTTRKLAIGVVKALTGKVFGYSPTESATKRAAAIARLEADL